MTTKTENCESTVIYPYTCLSQVSDDSGTASTSTRQPPQAKCEFLLEWSAQSDGIVRFALTKYQQQFNQWVALIFSNNLDDNLVI